jgi:hypothetical protein
MHKLPCYFIYINFIKGDLFYREQYYHSLPISKKRKMAICYDAAADDWGEGGAEF